MIHYEVMEVIGHSMTFLSSFYRSNNYMKKRSLWDDIMRVKSFVERNPWVVLGNFNEIRRKEEKFRGRVNDILMRII